MDKRDFVQTRIRTLVADPIVSALPTELAAVDSAIRVANLRYFTACPYRYENVIVVDVQDQGTYTQDITYLISSAFSHAPSVAAETAYYLGVMRISDASFGTSIRSFDSWLLGVPLGSIIGDAIGTNDYSYGGQTNPINIINYDRLNLDATNFGTMTGRVEFRIDNVKNTVTYLMPSFYGQVTVEHAFGFDDPNMTFIPMNHFDIFCKIVSYEFLDMIVRARSSIELSGDFRINIQDIAKRRDAFKEELRRDMPAISPIPMLWG